MDEARARLSRRERSTLRQIEDELTRRDPELAASLTGLPPASMTWPRVFRLKARTYLALGALLTLTAVFTQHAFTFFTALACFVGAAWRAKHSTKISGPTDLTGLTRRPPTHRRDG